MGVLAAMGGRAELVGEQPEGSVVARHHVEGRRRCGELEVADRHAECETCALERLECR